MSDGFLLTRSPSGAAGQQDSFGVKQYNMSIASGDTITLDQIDFSTFASGTWMVTAVDPTSQTTNTRQLMATVYFSNNDVDWIQYGFIGDTSIILDINFVLVDINQTTKQVQLVCSNPQPQPITLHYARYNLAV